VGSVVVAGLGLVLAAAVSGRLLWSRVSRSLLVGWLPVAALVAGLTALAASAAAGREQARLRSLVEGMAPTYALELQRHHHADLGLDTPPDDPRYLELVETQKAWLLANPAIADVYTFRRRDDGAVVLLVDSETDYDRDGRFAGDREARTAIGEVYPNEEVDEVLQAAFAGRPGFLGEPVTDRWGTWVSAYVPLRADDGRVEAVLGVDFPAESWLTATEDARRSRLLVGLTVVMLLGGAFVIAGEVLRERQRRSDDVERLERAVRAAESATAARTELLRTVTHEIRNPLNGVMGMSELLLETQLDADQRYCAETVHRSGQLLLQTLDGVLDFAKIEAGAMEYESLPTDVRDLAGTVVQLFAEPARRKKVELYARVDADVPDVVRLDPTRIRQVLVNLVSNAVKFTPAGEVELKVCRRGSRLAFDVRDTGIGIAEDRLANLFTPFRQAEGAATARRFGGSGLGLSIGRGLVEGMGGSLTVTSAVAHGSTFTVAVPIVAEPNDELRRTVWRGRTILVVEPPRRRGAGHGRAPGGGGGARGVGPPTSRRRRRRRWRTRRTWCWSKVGSWTWSSRRPSLRARMVVPMVDAGAERALGARCSASRWWPASCAACWARCSRPPRSGASGRRCRSPCWSSRPTTSTRACWPRCSARSGPASTSWARSRRRPRPSRARRVRPGVPGPVGRGGRRRPDRGGRAAVGARGSAPDGGGVRGPGRQRAGVVAAAARQRGGDAQAVAPRCVLRERLTASEQGVVARRPSAASPPHETAAWVSARTPCGPWWPPASTGTRSTSRVPGHVVHEPVGSVTFTPSRPRRHPQEQHVCAPGRQRRPQPVVDVERRRVVRQRARRLHVQPHPAPPSPRGRQGPPPTTVTDPFDASGVSSARG
jgi:signal transduction histidine kinase